MRQVQTPSGLGKPVRPFIRFLAAVIGLVGALGLVLIVFLAYFGAGNLKVEFATVSEILLFGFFAGHGLRIAFTGNAPRGVMPWQ